MSIGDCLNLSVYSASNSGLDLFLMLFLDSLRVFELAEKKKVGKSGVYLLINDRFVHCLFQFWYLWRSITQQISVLAQILLGQIS